MDKVNGVFFYIGVTMPALSVKTCHFERCYNNTKN